MLYKKTEIGYNEILVSSPVKSGDIFMGEFLGLLPFHLLGVLLIGPIITSLIMQIKTLTFLDFLIIYICIFVLINLGLLIGNLIANSIEYFISIKNYSELKNELILIFISLVFIVIFYLFHYLFTLMISHPEVKNWLMFYPSFWYSNIIIFIIDRNALDSYLLNIWFSCALATIAPLLCFFFSYRISNKFYFLGMRKSSEGLRIERENKIYSILRCMVLNKYKILVITQFKEFLRKKENLIKIIYVYSLTIIAGIILSLSSEDIGKRLGRELIYLNELSVILLSWIGGFIFGILIGIYFFLSSEEMIYLYKRTPRGLTSLVSSYVFEMVYIIIFLDLLVTLFFIFLFKLQIVVILVFFLMYFIHCVIILFQVVGIQCYNPLFDERSKDLFFNLYLLTTLQILSLTISLFITIPSLPYEIDLSLGLIIILITNSIISLGFSFLVLFLGFQKLKKY